MEERYWSLFCATGDPLIYLLYRRERERREIKTAWHERSAEQV